MNFFYQKRVLRGTSGGFYFVEPTGYKRYVDHWDVRQRKIPVMFPQLPDELNVIIWHFKRQLECSTERWDNFIMSLTTAQYQLFKKKTKSLKCAHTPCVRGYISFALQHFPASSRVFKKAEKQLLNY